MSHKKLWELARIGTDPEEPPLPKRPRGRPRKHLLGPTGEPSAEWEEILVGIEPSRAVVRGRLCLEEDTEPVLVGE